MNARKIMRIALCLFLALVFSLSFVSCGNKNGAAADTTATPIVTTVATETPSTTEPITTAPETEPDLPDLTINAENMSSYTIVYGEQAPNKVKSEAIYFAKRVCKGNLSDASDEKTPVGENEIVLGETNRPRGSAGDHLLRKDDYVIFVEAGRIYIIGGTPDATLAGFAHFQATYFSSDSTTITVKEGLYERYDASGFPIRSISVNGENLMKYTVVYPQDADLYTQYAVANFLCYLSDYAGLNLDAVPDDQASGIEYRILLGDTALTPAGAKNLSLSDGEFLLACDGKDIVARGQGYLIGASLGALIRGVDLSKSDVDYAITLSAQLRATAFRYEKARSAILLIGDGMGFNTIGMSLSALPGNLFTGADMPARGEQNTSSLSTLKSGYPTDSAAGGTALSTGYRTFNGLIGLDGDEKEIQTILERAHAFGAKTGVITTDSITGATPCAFLVHYNDRNDTDTLQSKINEVKAAGGVDWCVGSVGDNLTTNTASALQELSRGGSPFFLMVEEGYIDKYSHNNKQEECINAVKRFNTTIAYCMEFVMFHPDTVVVLTADHETGGITQQPDGTYAYTATTHTGVNVPLYAIGYGTERFHGKASDNVEIPKFFATFFGNEPFGSSSSGSDEGGSELSFLTYSKAKIKDDGTLSGNYTESLGTSSAARGNKKWWEDGNTLWLDFSLHFDDEFYGFGVRLRTDSNRDDLINFKADGTIEVRSSFFTPIGNVPMTCRLEQYGWHRISIGYRQTTTADDARGTVTNAYFFTLIVDGETIGTYQGDASSFESKLWNLYTASYDASVEGHIRYTDVSRVYWQVYKGSCYNDPTLAWFLEYSGITCYCAPTSNPCVKIVYQLDGGSFEQTETVATPDGYSTEYACTDAVYFAMQNRNLMLTAPVRAGYQFAGWYTNADFSGESIAVPSYALSSGGPIVLYVKWVENP